MIGTLFSFQLGILWWKQNYYSSFRNVTLIGLWCFPILFALSSPSLFWRFILVWTGFSIATALILSKALRSPLEPLAPRIVYKWFLRIHQLCSNAALFGYMLVLLDYFLSLSGIQGHTVSSIGLTFFFYGVYLGVLARDLSELCSERMASVIGVRALPFALCWLFLTRLYSSQVGRMKSRHVVLTNDSVASAMAH